MIKGLLESNDGKTIVVLGLSRRNTELLLQGRPIAFDLREELGEKAPDGRVILLGGETENAIQRDLETVFQMPDGWG